MTPQRVYIEVVLCVKPCPPATLVFHMMFLCFSLYLFCVCLIVLAPTVTHYLLLLDFSVFLQMQGLVKIDSDSEQKFIEGTLAGVPSPSPTEPQTPMDAAKASIYR